MNSSPNGRNISLDLIKVLAMTFVMALHTFTSSDILSLRIRTISGIAIPLFFMVSGFLLIHKQGSWKYSVHKIISIIRFVSILAITIAIARRIIHPTYWIDLQSWIVDITGPYLQKSILWVLWYLGAMCFIYALLPIINSLYKKFGNLFIFISTLLWACICNICFSLNITIGFEQNIIQTFRIQNWILYFFIGATLSSIMPQIKMECLHLHKVKYLCYILPLIFAFSYSLFIQHISYPNKSGIEYSFGSTMCMAYSIVTFVCISLYKPGKFVTKWVKILSNLFLPAFVIHTFVILALTKVMPQTAPDNYIGIFKFLIVWIVTISISYIIMKTSIGRWVFRI